ncbi:class I SAM-dependent methyltransferase [Chloroflexota bacterium]
MNKSGLKQVIENWELPEGDTKLERIESMIKPALMAGYFSKDPTAIVSGSQYHLGGATDTRELGHLASIDSTDRVLDVCCYLGGPAVQLAESFKCRVTGVDINENYIVAARRIADLVKLSDIIDYHVADAVKLPFDDGQFTVVWSQCSVDHDERWFREFDRILKSGGRLAFTFQIRGDNTDESRLLWTLHNTVTFLENLGYRVIHAEDITQRDIEIGWKDLDRRLTENEEDFITVLGKDWVNKAHEEFMNEINRMRKGEWGNGRIVAVKS